VTLSFAAVSNHKDIAAPEEGYFVWKTTELVGGEVQDPQGLRQLPHLPQGVILLRRHGIQEGTVHRRARYTRGHSTKGGTVQRGHRTKGAHIGHTGGRVHKRYSAQGGTVHKCDRTKRGQFTG
jgi:hypothetical protein